VLLAPGCWLFKLTQFAREMRKAPTRSEALLWAQLRGRKIGPRVRRQHVLHPCIVDFYVASHRLVVEIDGGIHARQRIYDARRDAFLVHTYGVRIVRIYASLVERDVLAAVALVRNAL
jgi:very-short-patch-repair endonuclease